VLDHDDRARLSNAIDVIPKSIMGSREEAAARFSAAFKKAGLVYVSLVQPVTAE
jgi:hypothetical protein